LLEESHGVTSEDPILRTHRRENLKSYEYYRVSPSSQVSSDTNYR
jgi:hypothetical protein